MAMANVERCLRTTVIVVVLAVALVAAGAYGSSPASAQPGSGSVASFGDSATEGGPSASQLVAPVVGMAATPGGGGYWLVAADGGVFSYGDAPFYGSEGSASLAVQAVGMASTPDGGGYWIVTDDGGVYDFGNAPDEGSMAGGRLDAPVVGINADATGTGYWEVAADGGVFSFGTAAFYGSMGGKHLNQPVVGMAVDPATGGYWLVAADGGVFAFNAPFYGSMGGTLLNQPVVGMVATPGGGGYWLVAADGGVFSFGSAVFHGSMGAAPANPGTPVVGMAAPDGGGYWLTTTAKALPAPSSVPSVLAECNRPGEGPAVEPTSIVLACGDGNASLTDLAWSSWSASSATGSGEYTHNLCVPDCASGTFVSTPASVELSYPVRSAAGSEFSTVTYSYATPTAPGGWTTYSSVVETNGY
ncbi:MAG: hypothetical protein ABSH29_22520 [Acidimicrobiales bacterium]